MAVFIDQNSSSNIPKISEYFVCKWYFNKADSFQSKWMEKISQGNTNPKIVEVTVLISDFQTRNIISNKEAHFIILKDSFIKRTS